MKIIISPAKKMNVDTDSFQTAGNPVLLERTERLMHWIQKLTYVEAMELWKCNDKITELNYIRFQEMDLHKCLTPALISYEGIQYQYMAPEVFTGAQWEYIQRHLRILSGFYGVLKPLDGVTPYRLEMQAKAKVDGYDNLYDFWGDTLYRETLDEDRTILNLASKEYSKSIEKYLESGDTFITCVFGEWKDGKVIQKGTQAKMARGEMVRYMAEHQIEDVCQLKEFRGLSYHYNEQLSSDHEYVFIKSQEGGKEDDTV